MKIAGLVLAGGQSRRMGGEDKALMRIHGRTLSALVVERLKPQVGALAVNSNGDPREFDDLKLPVIADTLDGHLGPLAGVLTGMRWAQRRGFDHIVTAAADTPFFPTDFVARLRQRLEHRGGTSQVAMTSSAGRIHPVFGLWPVALADALELFLINEQGRKILAFAERYGLEEVVFEAADLDPFFNINTPDDLKQALQVDTD